jgi:hypothetical protein
MERLPRRQPAEINQRAAATTDLAVDVTDLYVSTFQALAPALDATNQPTSAAAL